MHFYDTGNSLAIWTLPYVFIFTRRPPLATIRVAGPRFPVWPQEPAWDEYCSLRSTRSPCQGSKKWKLQFNIKTPLYSFQWDEERTSYVLRSQTTETLLLIRFGWLPSIALDLLDDLLWWKADSKSQCSFYSWISTSINNGIIDSKPELIKVVSFLQLQLDQC